MVDEPLTEDSQRHRSYASMRIYRQSFVDIFHSRRSMADRSIPNNILHNILSWPHSRQVVIARIEVGAQPRNCIGDLIPYPLEVVLSKRPLPVTRDGD